MRIGVFTVLFQNLPYTAMLDRVAAAGLEAVEIGTGGYPGNHHCPLDRLLENASELRAYRHELETRHITLSALSCQDEPLSPSAPRAAAANLLFEKTVRLAAELGVPVVNVASGTPGGAPGDTTPNWVTCAWPPHYRAMLDYQWNDVAIPYWRRAADFARQHGVKVAVEMHPGFLVHNVDTLLRLREAAGESLGCNLDPSHLFWNGVHLPSAIRKLSGAIFHMHGKDCSVDPANVAVNGCIDGRPYERFLERSWTFRTIGYGHDDAVWKEILSALRLVGYDYVISIEHEDGLMSAEEGFRKSVAKLKELVLREAPGPMYWA